MVIIDKYPAAANIGLKGHLPSLLCISVIVSGCKQVPLEWTQTLPGGLHAILYHLELCSFNSLLWQS